jgi:hypothetical protein|tara:strand:- start:50 stop:478 length:429 start_codon:yes stop_codon:yes gene_type:complete
MYKELNKIFSMIQTELKSEKVELTNEDLNKIDLSLRNVESIISQSKTNTKNLQKSQQALKEIKKLATGQSGLVKGGLTTAETLNKSMKKAYDEAINIFKQMNSAGIETGPLEQRIKEIRNAGNDLQNNVIGFQNLVDAFKSI